MPDTFQNDFFIDPRVEDEARSHASSLIDTLHPAFPRTHGKPDQDPVSRKSLSTLMPRHLLDLRSQRRNRSIDPPDDLSLPDFIQGFTKLILTHSIQNRTVKSMIMHLSQVGEDTALYGWPPIREWSNTVLHDIAANRYSWKDSRHIESERNRAAIHAGATRVSESEFNVCPLYNQGKCLPSSSHGHLNIHACAFCWLSWGVENIHPISICKKRLGSQVSHQNRHTSPQSRNRNYHRRNNNSNQHQQQRDYDPKNE